MKGCSTLPLAVVAAAIVAGPTAAQTPPVPRPAAGAAVRGGPAAPRADSGPIAVRPHARSDVLNINGVGRQELHNRFITAGLLAYAAVIVGIILMLGRRWWAGAILMTVGLAVSLMLYLGVFG